jgi:hypothetical protein
LRAAAISLSLLLAACGRGQDHLRALFADDVNGEPGSGLVGAPARTVDVVALTGTDCDLVLSRTHDDTAAIATIIARHTTHFPISSKSGVLDNLPRGRPIVLDVAAYDTDQVLMARGCEIVTLDPGRESNVDITLSALPQCSTAPVSLDLVIVLDTSNAMSIADPSNYHMDDLSTILVPGVQLPTPVLFTFIHHNSVDGVVEKLPATTDVTAAQSAIEALRPTHKGVPRLYDAITLAASKLRARAICTYKPAMLVLSGDADGGSVHVIQDAIIGITAAAGDTTDDIFTYGVGLSNMAFDELNMLIPMGSGEAYGADGTSDFQIKARFEDAEMVLRKLITGG